jgi:hypothetical protein
MALASVALQTARVLLNDAAATLWTDTTLLPYLQEAHREMQVRLSLAGLPVVKTVSTVLSVPLGTVDLTVVANYPTDLIEPIDLYERKVGESESGFVEMSEVSELPTQAQSDRLNYWLWESEKIKLLGATVATEVRVRYTKGLTVPASGASSIGVAYGEIYLGARTAALAAHATDNQTLYEAQSQEALMKLDDIVGLNIKGQQGLPKRRLPYRRPYGPRVIR